MHRFERFGEFLPCMDERRRTQHAGVGTQVVLDTRRLLAVVGRHLDAGERRQILHVRKDCARHPGAPEPLTFAGALSGHAEVGDMECERPALVLGHALERGHGRSGNAERDRVVETIDE